MGIGADSTQVDNVLATDQNALIVAGPTASGKSALAIDVAEAFGGTVINADSMQVYRELDILTARPRPEDLARAPHRLFGLMAAAEVCSAGRWRALALKEIAAAFGAGRLPIIVGGTGMYLRSLIKGVSRVPPIPEPVRGEARARFARLGGARFHAVLAARDPEMAARLEPSDSQRLVRAWEVIEATGISLADWQRGPDARAPGRWRFLPLVLDPPRESVYAACEARFDRMIERGAIEEVRALLALGLDPGLPAMKAVGVPELARHLAGEIELDEVRVLGHRATRRYAKRQMTWFRHQLTPWRRVEAQYSESLRTQIFSFILRLVLTGTG